MDNHEAETTGILATGRPWTQTSKVGHEELDIKHWGVTHSLIASGRLLRLLSRLRNGLQDESSEDPESLGPMWAGFYPPHQQMTSL